MAPPHTLLRARVPAPNSAWGRHLWKEAADIAWGASVVNLEAYATAYTVVSIITTAVTTSGKCLIGGLMGGEGQFHLVAAGTNSVNPSTHATGLRKAETPSQCAVQESDMPARGPRDCRRTVEEVDDVAASVQGATVQRRA